MKELLEIVMTLFHVPKNGISLYCFFDENDLILLKGVSPQKCFEIDNLYVYFSLRSFVIWPT